MLKRGKDVLLQSDIDKTRLEIYEQNQFELVPTESRNVLFCGRSRSGKSTIISVLKNPCYHPTQLSIFSQTVGTKFQSFSIKNKKEEQILKFTVNVVDTPGTFEVTADGDRAARSNEAIADTITKCLENEITHLHVVFLFVTFDAGINPDDVESMRLFIDMFKTADGSTSGVKIALCITRADNHNELWRDSITAELKRHAEISQMIQKEHLDILFMGCVDKGRYVAEDDLYDAYVEMYNLRKIMLEYIFNAEHRFQLSQMKVTMTKVDKLRMLYQTATNNLKQFMKITDWTSKESKDLVEAQIGIMSTLRENKSFTTLKEFATSDIMTSFVQVLGECTGSSTIPDDVKKSACTLVI